MSAPTPPSAKPTWEMGTRDDPAGALPEAPAHNRSPRGPCSRSMTKTHPTLAATMQDRDVETVESLARNGRLSA